MLLHLLLLHVLAGLWRALRLRAKCTDGRASSAWLRSWWRRRAATEWSRLLLRWHPTSRASLLLLAWHALDGRHEGRPRCSSCTSLWRATTTLLLLLRREAILLRGLGGHRWHPRLLLAQRTRCRPKVRLPTLCSWRSAESWPRRAGLLLLLLHRLRHHGARQAAWAWLLRAARASHCRRLLLARGNRPAAWHHHALLRLLRHCSGRNWPWAWYGCGWSCSCRRAGSAEWARLLLLLTCERLLLLLARLHRHHRPRRTSHLLLLRLLLRRHAGHGSRGSLLLLRERRRPRLRSHRHRSRLLTSHRCNRRRRWLLSDERWRALLLHPSSNRHWASSRTSAWETTLHWHCSTWGHALRLLCKAWLLLHLWHAACNARCALHAYARSRRTKRWSRLTTKSSSWLCASKRGT